MPRILRHAVAGLVAAATLLASLPAAEAQKRRIGLVRDAEAEALVRDYARPILKAAGLGGATIQIKLVDDRSFNAFVADGRHIFLNVGTLIDSETPGELIGVIAHETGHLAGGHLARLREAITRAQILAAIAMIGGAAAAVAGSQSDLPGVGQAGAAVGLGGAQVGMRSLLAYQRGEETTADRAALSYLEATGQSARGMLKTFERLASQQLFAASFGDPYVLSHPLAQDRIAQLEELARASPHYDRPEDPDLQRRHDMVRAKVIAFTGSRQQVERAYPAADGGLPAAYARAILAWRFGDPRGAARLADDLIADAPKNPWFWELKGQVLLEGGDPRAAVEPLRRAVALAPKEGLIRVLLGRALVGSEDPGLLKEAVKELTRGLGDDPDQPIGYRQLAIAHARLGDIALADLATAQGAFASGDIEAAKQYAQRAQAKLKVGTPAWLRADDILAYKPPRG
jgi:predicted Zn-dependent protease